MKELFVGVQILKDKDAALHDLRCAGTNWTQLHWRGTGVYSGRDFNVAEEIG